MKVKKPMVMSVTNKKIMKLKEKAGLLPKMPGCYLMRNRKNTVIYVGKAKNLKSRVTSYFGNSVKTPKTEILVSHIEDFDFLITGSESEAFILENNLIKEHSPKYNIMLRDDKSYPYASIDYSEPFPRIKFDRRPKRNKKNKVFGPFVHGSSIGEIITLLTKSLMLRDCSVREFNSRKTPCLLYQMHQCSAPCVGKISNEEYEEKLKLVISFFKGKPKKLENYLTEKMLEYSDHEQFERAGIVRDQIEKIKDFNHFRQKNVEFNGEVDTDIIAFYYGEVEIDISIYLIRDGALLGQKNFHFLTIDFDENKEEELHSFINQYYSKTYDSLPKQIIVDKSLAINDELQSSIEAKTKSKIKLISVSPKWEEVYNLTYNHAKESQKIRILNQDSVYIGLIRLKELLGLKERPKTIECYDIAIFQGKNPTASRIHFYEGKPVKKNYRYYHLEERPEGNNDFAMMEEVIKRRVEKGDLPDVIIVDGGMGQVNIAKKIIEEQKLDIAVAGIAKSKSKSDFKNINVEASEERLIIPGRKNPYILKKCPSLFKIVVTMRDEAHRFSRKLHHKAQKRDLKTSWLDGINGIGPKTKEKVLKNLDFPVDSLKTMNVERISQVLGISRGNATKISKYLNDDDFN